MPSTRNTAPKLTKRTVLITGGTSGIGLALATRLVQRGNTVIVTGRDPARLAAATRDVPGVNTMLSDVSDPGAIAMLYARVISEFPTLDVLVNNAGIMRNLDLNQTRALEDVTRELDVDLSGPVRMVQQFLPHLAARPEAVIVNVSSGLAFVPYPLSPVYSAAKAGLHAYTRILRVQLAGTRVTVVELVPPATETPLLRALVAETAQKQKGMDVDELAVRAIVGIEAGRLEIRPGLSNVLRILSRLAPGFALRQLVKAVGPTPRQRLDVPSPAQ